MHACMCVVYVVLRVYIFDIDMNMNVFVMPLSTVADDHPTLKGLSSELTGI